MGVGAAAVPYALAALSAGVGAWQADDTSKRQDREAAAGIRQQGATQRQADERVNAELAQLEGSSPEQERRASQDAFMQELQRSRATAASSMPGVAGASGRYGSDLVAADAAATGTAAKVADLMARINAPALQRQREGSSFGRAGSDLNVLGRRSAGDDFITQLRARSIRANPWITAGGQVLGGVGAGMASGGGAAYSPGAGTPEVVMLPNGQVVQTRRPVLYQN